MAFPLGSLGDLETKLGNYGDARSYYEQSLEMKRHVYGTKAKNTDLAFTLNSLGLLEQKLGNFDEARFLYEQAFEMKHDVYGPNAKNTNLASTLHNLGNRLAKLLIDKSHFRPLGPQHGHVFIGQIAAQPLQCRMETHKLDQHVL